MKNEIIFTVIMAAYNSARTIKKALKSIRMQDFEQSEIELLVIDGGSSDNTRTIARNYGATVLDNPVRLPEPAKTIGLKYAHGKYVCIMDSDEILTDRRIFQKRYEFFTNHPKVKCLSIGLSTPKHSRPCSYYMNAVGDPFSCFIYRTYTDSMEGLIKKKCKRNERGEYIACFGKDEIKPIGDSGVIMERSFIFSHYADCLDKETTSALFERTITDTHYVGYVDGDKHLHDTSSDFKTFFRKLKFRIINNIYDVAGSGYANKAQKNRKLNRRKYLYPFYAASVVFPIWDGIRMCFSYRHWIFLLHPVFVWYVLVEVMVQYCGKLLGKDRKNQSYGM